MTEPVPLSAADTFTELSPPGTDSTAVASREVGPL
jgi:hypothetical protein